MCSVVAAANGHPRKSDAPMLQITRISSQQKMNPRVSHQRHHFTAILSEKALSLLPPQLLLPLPLLLHSAPAALLRCTELADFCSAHVHP